MVGSNWMMRIRQRDRLERKREQRLNRLLQKREALEREKEIRRIYGHKKQRGKINSLPHMA